MIATNIKQSKTLVELGLNPKRADMLWVEDFDHNYDLEVRVNIVESYNPDNLKMIPAWSLNALLEIIPIWIDDCNFSTYPVLKDKWICKYFNSETKNYKKVVEGRTPVEAAYNIVLWLLENDYISSSKK